MPPKQPAAHPVDAHDESPRRVWDPARRLWIEAQVNCRNGLGRFARKNGTEPSAQLLLPFTASNGAKLTIPLLIDPNRDLN